MTAAQLRAHSRFRSLERLRQLPPGIAILPAHTSEPVAFDGAPIAARLGDVETWLAEWLASEDAFVQRVTSNLPPTPANFDRIIDLNEQGVPPPEYPAVLEAGANRCAVL